MAWCASAGGGKNEAHDTTLIEIVDGLRRTGSLLAKYRFQRQLRRRYGSTVCTAGTGRILMIRLESTKTYQLDGVEVTTACHSKH